MRRAIDKDKKTEPWAYSAFQERMKEDDALEKMERQQPERCRINWKKMVP